MDDRLLKTSIKVLRLFLVNEVVGDDVQKETSLLSAEQIQKIGLTTSEIIRSTSGDRSHVIAAIRLLTKQKLIREAKGWKPGFKKNIRPTAFGFEILKLIEDITTLNKTNQHLRPLIEKKRNDHMKNIEEPLGSGYSRIKDLSHYEVQKLAIYYNRLGNLNTMVTNFMLSILIYRFTDLKDRYSPKSDGLKILQKIIMDQIASLLSTIDTYRPRHEDQFDPCYAIQNLNSMWRWVLFMNTGNKILDDIQAYYSNNAITVNESMRPKIREVFGNVLNLLNPPKAAIDMQLSNLRKVAGLVYEEYFNTDGTVKDTKSREAAIEDVKTILLNNQKYLQRYKEYVTAFDSS